MTEQNTMTLVRAFAEIIERQVTRFEHQGAEYERKLAEHRTSFGARTEADAKIIAGLRAEIVVLRAEVAQRQSTLNALQGKIREMAESLGKSLDERDALRAELARLKSQTPKHPAKVGEWVKRLTPSPMTPAGGVAKVTDVFEVHGLAVKIERPDGIKGTWWAKCCEPCDPPAADHDTDAGKASAESALKTEPVERGDLVKVFQATGSMTDAEDIGCGGVVYKVDGLLVWLDRHHTMDLPRQGVASLSDVRKVTT